LKVPGGDDDAHPAHAEDAIDAVFARENVPFANARRELRAALVHHFARVMAAPFARGVKGATENPRDRALVRGVWHRCQAIRHLERKAMIPGGSLLA
jgi:hypothetical protein